MRLTRKRARRRETWGKYSKMICGGMFCQMKLMPSFRKTSLKNKNWLQMKKNREKRISSS